MKTKEPHGLSSDLCWLLDRGQQALWKCSEQNYAQVIGHGVIYNLPEGFNTEASPSKFSRLPCSHWYTTASQIHFIAYQEREEITAAPHASSQRSN